MVLTSLRCYFLNTWILNVLLLLQLSSENVLGDSMNVVYYFGPAFSDNKYYRLDQSDSILNNKHFTKNKTLFYIHGFQESQAAESISLIVNAYLQRGDHNILMLDYYCLVNGLYMAALYNFQTAANAATNFLLDMFRKGLDPNSIHLVGHSLGGQLVGTIARIILQSTNGAIKLPRVTALDPALPGFYIIVLHPPISSDVAIFVDIIHTDAGLFGSDESGGHADFWPNNGVSAQPGCLTTSIFSFALLDLLVDLCSHRQSYRYWAESVLIDSKEKFLAVKFNRKSNVTPKNCDETVTMGIDCFLSACGDYYLRTNYFSPYAMDIFGMK